MTFADSRDGTSEVAAVGEVGAAPVSAVIGGTRIYGFTASARSTDNSYISANAHGQIEKHALISPLLGIFLFLVGISAAGYVAFRPKPPELIKIMRFTAVPPTVSQTQTTMLTWEVNGISPSDRHLLLSHHVGDKGMEIIDGELPATAGKQEVTPDVPFTIYKLTASGSRDQKPVRDTVKVNVIPLKPPAKPVIKFFTIAPRKIHAGETVTLSWAP